MIKNIPLMFWLFIIGSIALFKKMLFSLNKKDSTILTILYSFLLFGLVFTRYSPTSYLDGVNFISKLIYYFSAFLLISIFIYFYFKYNNENNTSFKKIKFEYLLVIVLLTLTLFSVRGAVRLVMILATIAPIFIAYLITWSYEKFKNSDEDTTKLIYGIILALVLFASLLSIVGSYQSINTKASIFIPGPYHQQWQYAMNWVNNNTDEDAVFAHWWDYGYWVQSIGERATVLDGGNAIAYWNYQISRNVITGDNQHDALEFLYNHNTTHLLIDSSEIAKYSPISSIGSDLNYDRLSRVGLLQFQKEELDKKNNDNNIIFSGGILFDEDLIINESDKKILLPKDLAGIGGIVVPQPENPEVEFNQPYLLTIYNNKQHEIKVRYLFVNNTMHDFESGIDAVIFIIPRFDRQSSNQYLKIDLGTALYLSPRIMRGLFAQLYLLDDPFNNFPNFNLVHQEDSRVIQSLRESGPELPSFIFINQLEGPIKIWEIQYTGKEEIKEEYQDTDYTKYIDWAL